MCQSLKWSVKLYALICKHISDDVMSLTPYALSIQNHHCCLYARKEEQLQIVKPFVKDSFIRREKLLYIYAPRCNLSGIEYLQQLDANFVQFHQKGHLELISVPEIFLEKDQFKTDRMIKAMQAAVSGTVMGLRALLSM